MSQEGIEAVFEFSDLKQTRVYREAKEEGKIEGRLECVPQLLALGLTLEQIAQVFDLSAEQVREAAQNYPAESI